MLRATSGEAGASGSAWIFRGMAVGAAVKLLISLAFLLPGELRAALPVLPKAELALEVAPALLGVGYILGYRQSAVCVAGALISAVTLTPLIAWLGAGLTAPLYPETERLVSQMRRGDIWSRYVRYIGAGAVATAGILTVLRGLPTMAGAFLAVARGLRRDAGAASGARRERTDRDLPARLRASAASPPSCSWPAWCPGVFAGRHGTAAARGAGRRRRRLRRAVRDRGGAHRRASSGVSSQPTSGIALVTLLGTASRVRGGRLGGRRCPRGVLTVGTIVAIAASKAGDISQDLKTGWLVGATPARQQLGQLIGAAFACWAVAGTVLLLGSAYQFGSQEIPAPQATLMKTIVEGVLAGALPWGLVLTGAGLSIGAMLCGVSGLAFAIGVYLPLATMAPLYVGGCVRALAERGGRRAGDGQGDAGVLAASGLVAGEGLAGVVVAGLVAFGLAPKALEPRLGGLPGEATALVLALAVCAFLYRGARSRPAAG